MELGLRGFVTNASQAAPAASTAFVGAGASATNNAPTTMATAVISSSVPNAGQVTTLPASSAPQSSSSINPGLIAGPVVGGVAVVAIVAFLVWYFIRKRYNSRVPAEVAGVGTGALPPSVPMGKIPIETISDHGVENPYAETPNVGSAVYSAPVSSGNVPQDVQEDNEEGPLSLPIL